MKGELILTNIGTIINKKDIDWSKYTECATWCNENNCRIADKGDYYEVVEVPSLTLPELQYQKITVLQVLLSKTDYIQSKYIDGVITEGAYDPIKTRRQEWRNAINSIQTATTIAAINTVTYATDIPTYE